MTSSPEALAAAKDCATFEQEAYGVISKGYPGPSRVNEESMLASLIESHFAPLVRLRNLAIPVVASSHELQDGRHDTREGFVLVDKAAIVALAAALAQVPTC